MSTVDFTTYQPPGLFTEAVQGQQVSVQSSAPMSVAIFGTSIGFRVRTESILVDPDIEVDGEPAPAVNRTLGFPGVIEDSVEVRNPFSGVVYAKGTDYSLVKVDSKNTVTQRDDLYTISRVIDGGHIQPGDTVEVTYRYTDPGYFDAHTFWDFDSVRDQYGPSFDENGNIISELTLAASFAFMNGARRVTLVAVDPEGETPTLEEYTKALDKLRDEPDIAIVVPATGMQAIQPHVKSHVTQQSSSRYERRAIIGRDGSTTAVTSAQLISDAQAMADRRVAIVSPASMKYVAPELNREVIIGGQFLAAAIAGISVSQLVSLPLTRRNVVGFSDLTTKVGEGQRNLESQNGLMVVERTRRNQIQIRHGVTTSPLKPLDREWSVTGQEDMMLYRIRDFLDNDGVIGSIIDDITLQSVKASAAGALEGLKSDRIIRDYRNLNVRQLEVQPDVVEVRFEWQPSMPLNYIVVRFSVNVTSGETTSTAPTT